MSLKIKHKHLKTRLLCNFFDSKKNAFFMQKISIIFSSYQDLLRVAKSLIPLFLAKINNFKSN